MGNKVRLKLDPTQKILLKRGLNKNGAAQRFFSNELRRKMDPYVPMRSGVLKNTAVVHESSVEYVTPYARRQYYENKGTGTRGKQWDKRCWAENGDQIVESVAKFAGGEELKGSVWNFVGQNASYGPGNSTSGVFSKGGDGTCFYPSSTGKATGINDGFAMDATHNHTASASNTGSGTAHNNMPPYITVRMWKRTA